LDAIEWLWVKDIADLSCSGGTLVDIADRNALYQAMEGR